MDGTRKRSWNVPAIGLGGAASVLAALAYVGSSGNSRCEETRIVTTETECKSFVGLADEPRCIQAFADATARSGAPASSAVWVAKPRSGSPTLTALVRDGNGWKTLDGVTPKRTQRACNRRTSSSWARSTSSYYGWGSTTGSPRTVSTGPSTASRGGFGSVGKSFSVSS